MASRVGGVPEVVSDGENGGLLPVGDLVGMAAASLEALKQYYIILGNTLTK